MSSKSELLDRAGKCARLMNLTTDPVRKLTFEQLGKMWIALADESASLSAQALAAEVVAIEEIQRALGLESHVPHAGLQTPPA
jgi:hypothetical protein